MRRLSLAIALISAAGAGLAAQVAPVAPAAPALVFEVAARGYLVGGRAGSMAGDTADDRSNNRLLSHIWMDQSLCGMGAGDNPPPATPWAGWRVTGEVVSQASGQMTVRVEWRRAWENGSRIDDGAGASQTFTLKSGERVELDRLVPATASRCGIVETRLEAAVVPRAAYLLPSQTMAGRASGSRGGGGGSGRGATAGGSGVSAAPQIDRRNQLEEMATAIQAMTQLRRISYDAELWLVHRKPDGVEAIQELRTRFGATAAQNAFPPITITTGRGSVSLDISSKLQVVAMAQDEAGYSAAAARSLRSMPEAGGVPHRLIATISRRVRAPGEPPTDFLGESINRLDVPSPADVLSFEFPPPQKQIAWVLDGHQISVRLRVTPAK